MNETPVDLTSIAVALGRIEEKVSHLSGMEERLRNVETAITEIQATNKPKTPWYVITGGLAGFAAFVMFGVDMLGRILP